MTTISLLKSILAGVALPPLVPFARELAKGMSSSEDDILIWLNEIMRPQELTSRKIGE